MKSTCRGHGYGVQRRFPRAIRQPLFPAVADPPDRPVCVVADEQRTVMRDRHADRAAPHRGVIDHEAGHEILVFAARRAVDHVDANDK